LIREDPALSPAAKAVGILGLKLAVDQLSDGHGEVVKAASDGLFELVKAKVTSDPENAHRNMVIDGASGAAAEWTKGMFGVEGAEPNIDGTFDQARDLMKEELERRSPKSHPDDETPLIR
jgi:hypothetical protein